jgi:archaellum component FlaC
MLISEMEAVLKSLDQRVGRIEQILPTLATKSDLDRYATKADLDRYATKDDLRNEIRGVKVLIEDVKADTRLLAEHMAALMQRSFDIDQHFGLIHRRLDQMGDVLQRLERR